MLAGGNVPLTMRFGLYQGDKLSAAAETAYRRLLNEAFLPSLQARMEEDIRTQGQRDPEFLYEALKAYIMLSESQHFDQKALKAFINFQWDNTLSRDVSVEQRKALQTHLDALLAEGAPTLPYPRDEQLIARSRTTLAKTAIGQRIYERLKRQDIGAGIPDFTIADAAGPSAPLVFTRESGEPLTAGVPGLFTHDGYHKAFATTSMLVTAQLADEESWVLGIANDPHRIVNVQLQANVVNDVRRLYLEEYMRTWDAYIADIKLIVPGDLAQTVQTTRILSGPDSPLPTLLRAIVKEVTLVDPSDPTQGLIDKGKAMVDAPREALNKMFGTKAPPTPDLRKTLHPESVVDEHYAPLRRLVTSAAQGQPAPIDNVTGLIKELYTLLVAADAATKSGNVPPPSDVPNKVKAEGGQLPEPIRSMVVTLVTSGAVQAFGATRGNLSQQLAASVGDFCARAISGRYPFDKNSIKDVTQEDFNRLFAPGGLFDDFFQKSLAPIVDTSTTPWSFRRVGDTKVSDAAETLAQFSRAQVIRDVFFRGGKGAGLRLEFRPLEMDTTITQLTLDVDGQLVKYSHGPQVPVPVLWPGPKGSTQVRLNISPPSAIGASGQVFEGPWALFRMLDGTDMVPSSQPERFVVIFNVGGRKAQFEMLTSSVENPFRLPALTEFRCPDRL